MQTFAKCVLMLLLSLAVVVYASGDGGVLGSKEERPPTIEIRKMPEPPKEPQAVYARIANTTPYEINCQLTSVHTDFWGKRRTPADHNFWVQPYKYSRWYPLGSIGVSWIWSCK